MEVFSVYFVNGIRVHPSVGKLIIIILAFLNIVPNHRLRRGETIPTLIGASICSASMSDTARQDGIIIRKKRIMFTTSARISATHPGLHAK